MIEIMTTGYFESEKSGLSNITYNNLVNKFILTVKDFNRSNGYRNPDIKIDFVLEELQTKKALIEKELLDINAMIAKCEELNKPPA